ncbi:MAG TPA: oligoribonuclease [Candidatus Saccharimonadales bacterium]|nr:oligoribonuclease [Candidatus Saccharimonadales bacterium]
MLDKNTVPTKLLWVDLEMTGLEAAKDVILEIAVEITDFNFKTLASYESRIKQKREVVLERMQKNIWWRDFPSNRDEFLDKLDSGKPLSEVEQELVKLVSEQFGEEMAVLAGNSIYNDRLFIKQWMQNLDLRLHYRMLDVSAWKIFMQGKYGEVFEKKEVHRAFDDIQASIAELQHYLEYFKGKTEL